MKITFYGHACLLVEHDGKRVLIDPFLSGNPASVIQPGEIKADAIVLTHGHSDHFGDTVEIAKRNDCPVIAVFELAGICQAKGTKSHGMSIGGAFDFEGFRVKLTPAWHSSSVRDGDHIIYAGGAAGVVLTMGGKNLYHAGDTALFSDLKLICEFHDIDAAALPIGDNFTMGPEEAVLAAEWVRPKVVIPIHYNTFPVIRQDPFAFQTAVEAKGIACRPLAPGQSLDV